VMRLLRRTTSAHTLEALGFGADDKIKIFKALSARRGLVLVTGPTGSGKTTTLYSLLATMTNESVSTVTIEDPVEYAMPHARQIQVQQKRGINFANGLRSILRQDPDVIMVGEIRDYETAALAASAALTGHLVLSTLHTNDAISTVIRFVEMGTPAYLVGATLQLVVSQRLVRKLCIDCRQATAVGAEEQAVLKKYGFGIGADGGDGFGAAKIYSAKGCQKCSGTGYVGRTVAAEILPITEQLRQMIVEKQSTAVLQKTALDSGLVSLARQALSKFLQGVTSFEEVIKIIHE